MVEELRLKEKTCIIAGEESNLLKGLSLFVLEEGATVILVTPQSLADGDSLQKKAKGHPGEFLTLDEKVGFPSIFDMVLKRFGGIDLLLLDGTLSGNPPLKPLEYYSDEETEKLFSENIRRIFSALRGAIPILKEKGKGKIILISHTFPFFGFPYLSPYLAQQGAIQALAKGLARELGERSIQINSICYGLMYDEEQGKTAISIPKEVEFELRGQQILKKRAYPKDICGALIYLASGASDFVTGQTIVVDGGFFLH